jgi:hypothetical protein
MTTPFGVVQDRPARRLHAAAVLACLLGIAGCASQQPGRTTAPAPTVPAPTAPARAPAINLSGFSTQFKEGYADGCASATGSQRRDATRYESDDAYGRGWRDGLAGCKR